METGKNQLSIEELFRQKLESAEVIPGAPVKATLMRKVSRKEFLRFNTSRFNIYYAGAAVAGLITAGVLLFSNPEPKEKAMPQNEVIIESPGTARNNASIPEEADEAITNVAEQENIAQFKSEQTADAPEEVKETITEPGENVIIPTIVNGAVNVDIKLAANEAPEKTLAASTGNTPLFEPSVITGCAPLKIHFDNLADSYKTFNWSFGDGGFSREKEPDWIYDEEGEYLAILKASDANGKTSSWSVSIKVFARPKAKFEILPEKALLPIDEIRFVNYSSGAMGYSWDFGDGNSSTDFEPVHKYLKYGRYDVRLTAISEDGCSDTLIIKNAFAGSDYSIKMPNAFIPNPYGPSGGLYSSKSDENAEIFHPVSSGVTSFQLRIFSKTGVLLFESNDINIGWDGYYKGQLCHPGVYAWKIKGNFSNGEPFTKMGDVTLLKN